MNHSSMISLFAFREPARHPALCTSEPTSKVSFLRQRLRNVYPAPMYKQRSRPVPPSPRDGWIAIVCAGLAATGLGLAGGCQNDVVITPEGEISTTVTSSAMGGASSGGGSGVGGASAVSSTVASSGSGGTEALRVNTPETDPGQWSYVSATIASGDPPKVIVQGPFMLKKVKGPVGPAVYLVSGTDCNVVPYLALEYVGGGEYEIPVLPGQSLCYEWTGGPQQSVLIVGYSPYP